MDQSRLNNRYTGAESEEEWLEAAAAAAYLGVKPATLYTYVSRGLLRRTPGVGGKRSRYLKSDLVAWKARHDARSGHGPVAAAALQYGEPVLDTSLAEITPEGPVLRGESAVRLAERGVSFEAAAELFWSGQLPSHDPVWEGAPLELPLDAGPRGLPHLALALAWMAVRDPMRAVPGDALDLARARRVLVCLVDLLVEAPPETSPGLAARLAAGWGVRAKGGAGLLDRALVLSLDHGQSASTFAARVAAGTGADLYACLQAALAALSGPRHGGACDRIEALMAEVDRAGSASRVLQARLARGEEIPGFGHRLYPAGDPRTGPLLAGAEKLGRRRKSLLALHETVEVMAAWGQPPPAMDFGLVAVARGLGLPPGAPAMLFALGRLAGWVGHVLEQRESGVLLRPRGRYVGT